METYGEAAPETVRDQVRRILSLDVDGVGFPKIGELDPVVGELQKRYSGLRPVLFYSPYEAAAWAIIGNRIRIVQAAKVKARMAEQLGTHVEVRGKEERAFPGRRAEKLAIRGGPRVGTHSAKHPAEGRVSCPALRLCVCSFPDRLPEGRNP